MNHSTLNDKRKSIHRKLNTRLAISSLTRLFFSVSLLALVQGCATVIEGGDQVINVSTFGCEAYSDLRCNAVNDDGSSTFRPPSSVSVDKDKDELIVSCESKDKKAYGKIVVESKYEAWNAGNILLGGVIGVGVDAATGAMWKYPSSIIVPMTCGESSSTPADNIATVKEVSEPANITSTSDSSGRTSAAQTDADPGTAHRQQVDEIGEAMMCNSGKSLLREVDGKQTWLLSCGDGETLQAICTEGTCILR